MIKVRWHKLDPQHMSRYTFHERAVHLIVRALASTWC